MLGDQYSSNPVAGILRYSLKESTVTRCRSSDMNEDSLDHSSSQKWMSITGQPLDLGPHESGFQGPKLYNAPFTKPTDLSVGQCVSTASYEKLNQLGEGSKKRQSTYCFLSRTYRVQLTASSTGPETAKALESSL